MNENQGRSMSAILRGKLKARIHHVEAHAGKVRVITLVTIIAGDTLEVAHARLGGHYNEQQALDEYEKFGRGETAPDRFTKGKANWVLEDHRPAHPQAVQAQTAVVEQGELVTV